MPCTLLPAALCRTGWHREVGQSPRYSFLPVAAPAPCHVPTMPCSTLWDGIMRSHTMGQVPGAVSFRHWGQALQVLEKLQIHATFWQTLLSQ